MSLFNKIFGGRPKLKAKIEQNFKTFTTYTPTFNSWGGAIYESELVRAAVDARARHCAKLTVAFEGAAKPTFVNFARKRPNNFMTWYQFIYRVSTILDVQNTAFIVPILDKNNEITGYYPILPSNCQIVTINDTEWIRYRFSSGDVGAIEKNRCGILTKHQYKDDFFGEKNTAAASMLEMIDFNRQGIKQGIKDASKVQYTARLTNFRAPEDLLEEQKNFSEMISKESGAFTLFPSTYDSIQRVKNDPYTVPADEADRIRKNVLCYFGVTEKVMDNSAIGDELDAFFDGCIEPFAIQMSEVMTRMTFTDNEQSYGAKVTLVPNRLQYMKTSDKINFIREVGDRGLMTVNEIREMLNYPPVENGDTRPARGEYFFIGEDGTVLKKENDKEVTDDGSED